MKSFENLWLFRSAGYISNHYFTASIPNSWGIFEYSASISNETSRVFGGTYFGRLLRKSVVSRRILLMCFVSGLKRISMKLLNLWVKHAGPAMIGRGFKSVTLLISMYADTVLLYLSLIDWL